MRLVYLSPVRWASFAQRPHKFVEWFHNNTDEKVLWVEPYPTRFPRWSDVERLRKPDVIKQLNSAPPWLTVIKPGGLPIEPFPRSGVINKWFWRNALEQIEEFLGNEKALLAIGKPSILALELLAKFRQCWSLYDSMDDFPSFYGGMSRLSLRARENKLVGSVKTVLVSSTALKRRWSNIDKDLRLVYNGLDPGVLPLFAKGKTLSKGNIFGYVGTIASWFDWDWFIALAESRPFDVIRLIGPVCTDIPDSLPSNIEMLPPRDHRAALFAMSGFDVGLIPFKKNNLTVSVDPIKYYEYRALGLPVISTDFGEMKFRSHASGVFISRSKDDIFFKTEAALSYVETEENRLDFIERNSWNVRFNSALSDVIPAGKE